ncbi:hypothetical protein BDV95DRAFT_571535 [Massariosphaeria phaeospora]|uniref:Uncharacterized protein n=1 Tax=Massariosphaeria phaeospora TaxID=100035 RepID=A0A7C8MPQ9_9PLEO|nr:hypothetical protein BDV95DRAFT_571535 [Massariosphaeria phaeospora]
MAPDLNSAQVSRQSSNATSRRTSQIYPMSPPPLPLASSSGGNASAATQPPHAFPPLSPSYIPNVEAAGVPMRHPRPLTAAELHLELEKEQEAVVNRLTRELSALRAHSASVASTTSSATSNALEATDASVGHTGAVTAARRHRSSSSVSRNAGPPHRYSVSSQQAISDPSSAHQARNASVVSTPRYEEVAQHRQELEDAKKENEVLKSRIRELERMIKTDTEGPRGRRGAPQDTGTGASGDATTQT